MATYAQHNSLCFFLLLLIFPHSIYSMKNAHAANAVNAKLLRFNALIKPEIQQQLDAFEQSQISPRTLLTEKIKAINKEQGLNPRLQQLLAKEATQEVMTLHTGKAFKEAYLAETEEQRTLIQLQAKEKQAAIIKIYNEFIAL